LSEPYRSWIDRAQPLPAGVRLLPRTVKVAGDVLLFLLLGGMFGGMGVLILTLGPLRFDPANEGWSPYLFLGTLIVGLWLVPLVLLLRAWRTVGAWNDRKRGTLRQGILVGPEGVLVRVEPNWCYPIDADRFVEALFRVSRGRRVAPASFFRIETLDGLVEFFSDRVDSSPDYLNRLVRKGRKPAAEPDAEPATPVPNWSPVRMNILDRVLGSFRRRSDPTRHWSDTDEPLPTFDLATGGLGGLRFGDGLESAEFLGRPDEVKQTKDCVDLFYRRRGFDVAFELGEFAQLTCHIAPSPRSAPRPDQGYSGRGWSAGSNSRPTRAPNRCSSRSDRPRRTRR
jgi:hypothetical protein